MNAPRIEYAIEDTCLYLKLEGELRCSNASTLERFIAAVFDTTPLDMAVIDLVHTRFLDSTNLGILASIAIKLRAKHAQKPLIVTGGEDMTLLLASMGFDQYFEIADASAERDVRTYSGINLAKQPLAAMSQTALQAHKNLAGMNANNRTMFKDVIELIEAEH